MYCFSICKWFLIVISLLDQNGYVAQGVTSIAECKFQLLAAFGIPTASQDMSPLHAWLIRGVGNAAQLRKTMPMGLVMHNIDGMLQDVDTRQQFTALMVKLLEVGSSLMSAQKLKDLWRCDCQRDSQNSLRYNICYRLLQISKSL